jgi:hypothetical protein
MKPKVYVPPMGAPSWVLYRRDSRWRFCTKQPTYHVNMAGRSQDHDGIYTTPEAQAWNEVQHYRKAIRSSWHTLYFSISVGSLVRHMIS